MALRHVDVELDGAVCVALVFEDGAAGGEVGGTKRGDHRLEDRVSVGAVHQNLELSAERDSVAGTLQAEIRNVSLAARGDRVQFSFEAAFRLQDARNAGEDPRSAWSNV